MIGDVFRRCVQMEDRHCQKGVIGCVRITEPCLCKVVYTAYLGIGGPWRNTLPVGVGNTRDKKEHLL